MKPGRNQKIERNVHELRAFAAGTPVVPVLIQEDPDPDGMAAALAVRVLLHRSEKESPIISRGEVTRAENVRMAELLGIRVVRIPDGELAGFRRVVAVDTQPAPAGTDTRWAVIDHHPVRPGYTADFVDIRPEIGAAATMLTQYLRAADEDRITPRLATALIYGIRTDTEVLRRGAAPADVEAYAFLQARADQELLRRIGRPAFTEPAVRALGAALTGLARDGEIAVAYAGRLSRDTAHVLPSLADFCLSIEGVSWSAAAGLVEDELVVNIRRVGGPVGAGDLAKAVAEEEGRGGGHRSMARVGIQRAAGHELDDEPGSRASASWLLRRLRSGVETINGDGTARDAKEAAVPGDGTDPES